MNVKTIGVAIVTSGVIALWTTSASAQSACCKPDGECRMQNTQEECQSFDGVWHEGLNCLEVVCEDPTTTTTVKVTTTTVKTTTTTSTIPKKAEGCTPGYWKQDHHFDSWVDFDPSDSFEDVFGRDVPGDPSLLQALQQGGGGLTALMRHAVAALLNASSPDVDPVPAFNTTAEVIAAFQAAFDSGDYSTTKDLFETSNQSGCPLN